MNVSQVAMRALFFMLSLNVGVYVLQENGIVTTVPTPIDPLDMQDKYNATAIVNSWGWSETQQFYDIGSALQFVMNGVRIMIIGFPDLLAAIGVPLAIRMGIYTLWLFLMVVFVWAFIKGSEL